MRHKKTKWITSANRESYTETIESWLLKYHREFERRYTGVLEHDRTPENSVEYDAAYKLRHKIDVWAHTLAELKRTEYRTLSATFLNNFEALIDELYPTDSV